MSGYGGDLGFARQLQAEMTRAKQPKQRGRGGGGAGQGLSRSPPSFNAGRITPRTHRDTSAASSFSFAQTSLSQPASQRARVTRGYSHDGTSNSLGGPPLQGIGAQQTSPSYTYQSGSHHTSVNFSSAMQNVTNLQTCPKRDTSLGYGEAAKHAKSGESPFPNQGTTTGLSLSSNATHQGNSRYGGLGASIHNSNPSSQPPASENTAKYSFAPTQQLVIARAPLIDFTAPSLAITNDAPTTRSAADLMGLDQHFQQAPTQPVMVYAPPAQQAATRHMLTGLDGSAASDNEKVGVDQMIEDRARHKFRGGMENSIWASQNPSQATQIPEQSTPTLGQSTPTLGQSTPTLGQSTPTLGQSTPTLGQSITTTTYYPRMDNWVPTHLAKPQPLPAGHDHLQLQSPQNTRQAQKSVGQDDL